MLAPDGAAYDEFGFSVAIDGDTAIVGAYGDQQSDSPGSAYVFTRAGASWEYAAKLTASDGIAGDTLGTSVAISGNTAFVGAPGFYNPTSAGAVYVFVNPGSGWTSSTETAKLTASEGAIADHFGSSVAATPLSDDTVLIGAPGKDSSRGAAYIFSKPPAGWASTSNFNARLTVPDSVANEQFGFGVAISNNTALVSSPGNDAGAGSAYVFSKGTAWASTSTFVAKLTASDRAVNDGFGENISMSSDTALIGAVGENERRGAAYIFEMPTTGWVTANEDAKLTASDGSPNDYFGVSVALSDSRAIVGAQGVNGLTGAAYMFTKPTTGWANATGSSKLVASDALPQSDFGWAVAISSNTILIGSRSRDVGGNVWQGAAYFYLPTASIVTNSNDSGPGSLRQALADAAAGDTITFDPSLAGMTIHLASTLVIDKDITIDGTGLTPHVIISGDTDADGAPDVMVFQVPADVVAGMRSLDIRKGGSKPGSPETAAGIETLGNLTISDCDISDNDLNKENGAILNSGMLSITGSTLSRNQGGAILSGPYASLNVYQTTFTDNHATLASGNIAGGGITSGGTLSVTDSIFTGNDALYGGAIEIYAAADKSSTISDSTFSQNGAYLDGIGGWGGAIFVYTGDLTVQHSTFERNTALNGGAIATNGGQNKLGITDSTFHANQANTFGGAIVLSWKDAADIRGSTFDENVAAHAGAIFGDADLVLVNDTFSSNSGTGGEGPVLGAVMAFENSHLTNNTFSDNSPYAFEAAGETVLENNIIANSIGGPDCIIGDLGSITSNVGNLIESGETCGTAAVTTDPALAPLTDNGGPTQTMALLPGSPAIDAGDDATCAEFDQRGIQRPQGAHCDIGAFELRPTDLPSGADLGIVAAFSTASAHPGDSVTLTTTLTNDGPAGFGSGYTVNAPVPTGLTYVSSTPSQGSYGAPPARGSPERLEQATRLR